MLSKPDAAERVRVVAGAVEPVVPRRRWRSWRSSGSSARGRRRRYAPLCVRTGGPWQTSSCPPCSDAAGRSRGRGRRRGASFWPSSQVGCVRQLLGQSLSRSHQRPSRGPPTPRHVPAMRDADADRSAARVVSHAPRREDRPAGRVDHRSAGPGTACRTGRPGPERAVGADAGLRHAPRGHSGPAAAERARARRSLPAARTGSADPRPAGCPDCWSRGPAGCGSRAGRAAASPASPLQSTVPLPAAVLLEADRAEARHRDRRDRHLRRPPPCPPGRCCAPGWTYGSRPRRCAGLPIGTMM